ncbi:MAG: enoyl-[acyl-carrier-protein] reductase FabK, partial [Desulfobacteraceae bacterium]
RRLRRITAKPFAVNIPLRLASAKEAIEVVFEEEVPVIVFSAGDPLPWVHRFKKAGRIVLQVVFNREMAERADQAGVDALIAMGAEAGGNLCPDEISTLVLVPLVKDTTDLPVIAAGGIADGRGLAAALALGAEAVQLGTRLLATREATVHPHYKQAVLSAGDTDTTVIGRSTGLEFRVFRNQRVREIQALERRGEDKKTIDDLTIAALRLAVAEGDLGKGALMMGQAVALIQKEMTLPELFSLITKEAEERLQALASLMGKGTGKRPLTPDGIIYSR